MAFPESFRWGVSTASYQIEGAVKADGRGPSIWDMRSRTPGKIWNGHTGDDACLHYERMEEDLDLMAALGVNSYRFSVAWPRVMPDGHGRVEERGLDFYSRLVDGLLARGITPFCTLYHWDLPLDLHFRGGWMNPDIPQHFADYVAVVVDRLSDRVQNWFTMNEPQVFIGFGLMDQPLSTEQRNWTEVMQAVHTILLSHGRAVQAIRAHAKAPSQVGMAPVGLVWSPATDSEADINAARKAMFEVKEKTHWQNSLWMDPIFFGRYPDHYEPIFGEFAPKIGPDDFSIIQQPMDFLAVNTYSSTPVRAKGDGDWEVVPFGPETPLSAYKWFIVPECLYWGPKFFHERYQVPIYQTENGISSMDWVHVDGKVHDPGRIDYLKRHLRHAERAIADGADLRGYFQWSLLDNFEWSEGYKERFGLVYVNYETGERIPKDSFDWYREVIRTNGASINT